MSLTANTKPGKRLDFDHPAMERVRQFVSTQIRDGNIHPQMVCNFDQVWCVSFRSRPRSLQLSSASRDPHASRASLRRLRHSMELCLGLPITEEFPDEADGGLPRALLLCIYNVETVNLWSLTSEIVTKGHELDYVSGLPRTKQHNTANSYGEGRYGGELRR